MAKKRTRDTEDRQVLWAVKFERVADWLDPIHCDGGSVVFTAAFMKYVDNIVVQANNAGALGTDPLLKVNLLNQIADHRKSQSPIPQAVGLTCRLLRTWVPYVAPEFGKLPLPGLVRFVEGLEGASLDGFEFTQWFREGLLVLARIIRNSVGPLVPTPFQLTILKALNGRALKKMDLAREVCGGEGNGNLLYREGGIRELRNRGLVTHKHGPGFYRPDAPPPNAIR